MSEATKMNVKLHDEAKCLSHSLSDVSIHDLTFAIDKYVDREFIFSEENNTLLQAIKQVVATSNPVSEMELEILSREVENSVLSQNCLAMQAPTLKKNGFQLYKKTNTKSNLNQT